MHMITLAREYAPKHSKDIAQTLSLHALPLFIRYTIPCMFFTAQEKQMKSVTNRIMRKNRIVH